MTRIFLASALVGALAVSGGGRQAPADPPRTRLTIDAVAFDRAGRPVMDLKPSEVEVRIGQFLVPIDTFTVVTPGADERLGRVVVLVLDDITVPLTMMTRVKEAARHFVTRLAPGDQMAVVMLNEPNIESTNDAAKLNRAIDTYHVRATGVMRLDQIGSHVLQTIGSIARAFAEAGTGRKVIVGIGSGGLFDRPLPPPAVGGDLLPEWIEAMKALSRTNTNFYAIDPGGVGTARMADGGEVGFARETGGHAFLNTNDLKGAADRIMRELGSYYAFAVASPPVGGSGLRPLDLRVSRKGVTIRARRAIH